MSLEGGVNYSLLLKPQIDTGVEIEFMASCRGLFGFSLWRNSESLSAANAILMLIYCHRSVFRNMICSAQVSCDAK